MDTKWTIGRRTLSGFIAVIFLAGLGGGFAVFNFNRFQEELAGLRDINQQLVGTTDKLGKEVEPLSRLNYIIQTHIDKAVGYAQVMIAARNSAEAPKAMQELALAKKATQEALDMSSDYGQNDIATAMQTALVGIDSYSQAVQQVGEEIALLSQAQTMAYDAGKLISKLTAALAREQKNYLTVDINKQDMVAINKRVELERKTQSTNSNAYQIQIAVDDFLRTRDQSYLDELEILGLRTSGTLSILMNRKDVFSEIGQQQLQDANQAFEQSQESIARLFDSLKKVDESLNLMNIEQKTIEGAIAKVAKQVLTLSQESDKEVANLSSQADEAMANSQIKLLEASLITKVSVGATLLVGLVLAMLIVRGLVRTVGAMAGRLSQTADQLTSASYHLSNSSDSLAEGASGQAASLEETTASLKELASMTKNNSENANQAHDLMNQTEQVGQEANQAMRELSQSMLEISEAGSEIGRIIKTIDQIAFQTNLLALNAAVEAARAGAAGAGFAVVADEVRNLALRAAEAAKDTQDLIQNTIGKLRAGSTAIENTESKFKSLLESTIQAASLVSKIASASNDQNYGLDQINRAMNQIDKVTLETANSAQESSSGAAQLLEQAAQLHTMLQELLALAGEKQQKDEDQEEEPTVTDSHSKTALLPDLGTM